MKKTILTFTLILSLVISINAQSASKAIGLRFGGVGEISYQQALGNTNRFELDLGTSSNQFGLIGIYHWIWDISDVADGLNLYAGPGATIGFTNDNSYTSNGLFAGIVAQGGIEYNFDFPLQISLDYRPEFYLQKPKDHNSVSYNGICLAARYKF